MFCLEPPIKQSCYQRRIYFEGFCNTWRQTQQWIQREQRKFRKEFTFPEPYNIFSLPFSNIMLLRGQCSTLESSSTISNRWCKVHKRTNQHFTSKVFALIQAILLDLYRKLTDSNQYLYQTYFYNMDEINSLWGLKLV